MFWIEECSSAPSSTLEIKGYLLQGAPEQGMMLRSIGKDNVGTIVKVDRNDSNPSRFTLQIQTSGELVADDLLQKPFLTVIDGAMPRVASMVNAYIVMNEYGFSLNIGTTCQIMIGQFIQVNAEVKSIARLESYNNELQENLKISKHAAVALVTIASKEPFMVETFSKVPYFGTVKCMFDGNVCCTGLVSEIH